MNMKSIIWYMLSACALLSCSDFIPDNKVDLELRDDQASTSYEDLLAQGMMMYDYLPKGYSQIDSSMLAAATDEADYAPIDSDIEKFQKGLWNPTDNPDDVWDSLYTGIRHTKLFLRNSENYEKTILRDTFTVSGLEEYKMQCADLKNLRAEALVVDAWLYFELSKRYGAVPIVEELYDISSSPGLTRSSYEDVVSHMVDMLEKADPDLEDDWYSYDVQKYGRITKGVARSLKSRILLYAARLMHNPENDRKKWEDAAKAAKDVIDMNIYELEEDYGSLFYGAQSHQSKETIFAYMSGLNNIPEILNYPVTTSRGRTGICPSGNLVDAYENIDGSPFEWAKLPEGANPYDKRDPRLMQSIVVNGSEWNGRTIETYVGGFDGVGQPMATTTGYYLKKFLTDNLDLDKDQTAVHSWILFRYGEILLNYAEAMNEAYGPDDDHFADGKTARWAVNRVRERSGMPPVVAEDRSTMRNRIKHERRVELAFEDHRFWDVRTWGGSDAMDALGAEIYGIHIEKKNDRLHYEKFVVEERIYTDKMKLYPIPQSEILLSSENLLQNPGW